MPWPARVTAGLVWFHRWLGIATCLVFAAWFLSGAVLLFQPFPSLAKREAAALAAPVALPQVRITPAQALAAAGGAVTELRLVARAGVPVYLASGDGAPAVIDARTGERLGPLDAAAAARVAAAASRTSVTVRGPFDYDQWIVHNQFDRARPFFRASLGDASGTDLYVSAVTGEILQRTTLRERAWNWVGAVLHWVYVTPLRASFTAWDQSVWWLSFVAMWVAVAGTVLGIVRTVAVKRAGRPGLSYFRPWWLRWHHLLGLLASVFVLAWILSGWLSMDHGRLFSRGQPTPLQQSGYAGLPLDRAAAAVPVEALARLPKAQAIGFAALAGVPILRVTGASGETSLFAGDGTPLAPAVRDRLVRAAIASAWPGQRIGPAETVPAADLHALAEGMPPGARRYPIGTGETAIYVDGATGGVLTVMDRSRAAYSWIYYALHTFKFPGLAERPLLRQILVLIPLTLGFFFSITGVVIGWRRLRRSLAGTPPNRSRIA